MTSCCFWHECFLNETTHETDTNGLFHTIIVSYIYLWFFWALFLQWNLLLSFTTCFLNACVCIMRCSQSDVKSDTYTCTYCNGCNVASICGQDKDWTCNPLGNHMYNYEFAILALHPSLTLSMVRTSHRLWEGCRFDPCPGLGNIFSSVCVWRTSYAVY